MVVVQTATEMLYVPFRDIASIMPTYPRRWRIVLADGRVGHRTGPLPDGAWVPLGEGWVRPEHLTRDGDFWRDPAGFRYAYVPLPDADDPQEEDEGLPEGLIAVESRNRRWFWRTETGETDCELNSDGLREVFPSLVKVNSRCLVDLRRIRKFAAERPKDWLELDTGERFEVGAKCYLPLASRMGIEVLSTQDLEVPGRLWQLREFPYDLTNAEPARITADLPDWQVFVEHLLWQTVLRFERGEQFDYGRDKASFFEHPVVGAAARCGYSVTLQQFDELLKYLVFKRNALQLRQLGFTEDAGRRNTGRLRPSVILLTPLRHRAVAHQAAEQAGVSLLLTGKEEQLPLECLAAELQGPLQLLQFEMKPGDTDRIRERLQLLGLEVLGQTVTLASLEQLEAAVQALPEPWPVGGPEPFSRIALQAYGGMVYVDPDEIASWSPAPPSRWQVLLKDGRIFHHPGPVPAIPPKAAEDQILWLESRADSGVWHRLDGSEVHSGLSYLQAAKQHPSLAALNSISRANYQHLCASTAEGLHMAGGHHFALPKGMAAQQWLKALGVPSFLAFGPDSQGLRYLQLRDVPYEIARAEADQLRQDFPGLPQLIANVLWQVACGRYRYGDGFSGFFYRPLQAILYRAGYLTRAQLRAPWRALSAKDRIYLQYCNLVTRMVKVYRLFDYDQLGFRDPFPENRILGERQPWRILVVEKGERLGEWGRRLQQEFGMTLLQTQGMPSLLAVKYLRQALASIDEVEIFFYGDFDEAGWDMPNVLRDHLEFYGCKCRRIERLVLASIFSIEEQNLYSRPLLPSTTEGKSRLARFLRESGGVQGQPRGIHANWLQPYERLADRWRELDR
jgi:hypothetical protein